MEIQKPSACFANFSSTFSFHSFTLTTTTTPALINPSNDGEPRRRCSRQFSAADAAPLCAQVKEICCSQSLLCTKTQTPAPAPHYQKINGVQMLSHTVVLCVTLYEITESLLSPPPLPYHSTTKSLSAHTLSIHFFQSISANPPTTFFSFSDVHTTPCPPFPFPLFFTVTLDHPLLFYSISSSSPPSPPHFHLL